MVQNREEPTIVHAVPSRPRRRSLRRTVLVAVATVVIAIAVVAIRYVDINIHYFERDMAAATRTGIAEKQVDIEGYRMNYAEGPDNGPPLILIHGQGSQWQD
jgi:hypothetical protein